MPAKRPAKRKPAKFVKRTSATAAKSATKPTKGASSAKAKAASLAKTGDVAWTPKLRGKIFASRAIPNPLHLTGGMDDGPTWVPDVPYPYNVDQAWTEVLGHSWTL